MINGHHPRSTPFHDFAMPLADTRRYRPTMPTDDAAHAKALAQQLLAPAARTRRRSGRRVLDVAG